MTMLILLLPLTTILVALVGFYVWHRQLVRKRHFEVADAALSAFCQAEAAIVRAREPTVGVGEGATRKRGDYELPAYGGLLDRLYIPVERLKVHQMPSRNWSVPRSTLRFISAASWPITFANLSASTIV